MASVDNFERIPGVLVGVTSKMFSWGDFLPPGDSRGLEAEFFLERLRSLFGKAENDTWVFRHRGTGLVVTAYCAQSGPSFGGGARLAEVVPLTASDAQIREALSHIEVIGLRVVEPPPPTDPRVGTADASSAELAELHEDERRQTFRMLEQRAPEGFAAAAAELAHLLLRDDAG